MRPRPFILSAILSVALPAAFALASAPALARQSESAKQASPVEEEIIVVAPRVMRTQIHERTPYGIAHYDLMTLTHHVGYADLNLAQPAGVKALKRRIRATANELCLQLANAPPAEPRSMRCVQQTIKSAMAQANAAIAAAKK